MNNNSFQNEEFSILIKEMHNKNLSSNITNNIDGQDNYYLNNFHYFNENENMENFYFEDLLMEEKIKNSQYDYNENNNNYFSSFNDDISSYENQENNFLGKKNNRNNDNKIIFKKNRNNLNNNIFKTLNDKNDGNTHNLTNLTNETSSSNQNNNKITYYNIRSDSLLIKFKSFLGKSFIKYINDKLKNLTKRKIKFYAFNYKKFTLNVSYAENKKWLGEKIKNLLVLGDQPNQTKNEKTLKSIYKRKEEEFIEIKNILELTYKEIIERFYLSEYFEDFKKDKKNAVLNENFMKIMNISLLDKNGFINFILSRKANKEKNEDMKKSD